jgi:hypothetical protein
LLRRLAACEDAVDRVGERLLDLRPGTAATCTFGEFCAITFQYQLSIAP